MDRIEKLYERLERGVPGSNEDKLHECIDDLLDVLGLDSEDRDEARITLISASCDVVGIEPDFTGPWLVTKYEVSREYGGAEEGGWYYDWYESPELIVQVPASREDALAICRMLNQKASKERQQEGRSQGRFSVLGGEDDVYVVEETLGSRVKDERPHYE